MTDPDPLTSIGIHLPDALSGLAGGIVRVLFTRGSPAEMIVAALGGALTSNYLANPFSHLAGKAIGEPLDVGVSGFVVGLTAMTICQYLIRRVGYWTKRKEQDNV